MEATAVQVGKRGTIEANEEGILIRPAMALVLESYTPQRQAEFLLSNAVEAEDYAQAVAEVWKLGLDPATIPRHKLADL